MLFTIAQFDSIYFCVSFSHERKPEGIERKFITQNPNLDPVLLWKTQRGPYMLLQFRNKQHWTKWWMLFLPHWQCCKYPKLLKNSSNVFTNLFHEFFHEFFSVWADEIEKKYLIGPKHFFFFSACQLKKKS